VRHRRGPPPRGARDNDTRLGRAAMGQAEVAGDNLSHTCGRRGTPAARPGQARPAGL